MTMTVEQPIKEDTTVYPCPDGLPWCTAADAQHLDDDRSTHCAPYRYVAATADWQGNAPDRVEYTATSDDGGVTVSLNVIYPGDSGGVGDAAELTPDEAEHLAHKLLELVALIRAGGQR